MAADGDSRKRLPGRATRHGLVALALLLVLSAMPLGFSKPTAAQQRPNFVVIVTDDMRAADWEALPKTQALLGGRGTRFEHFFVTTSLCCPSRVSILTGQYVHNHGVTFDWKQFGPNGLGDETFAWALDQAGYRTALIGKYLNGYPEKRHKPPGWDRSAAVGNGDYFRVVLNENGKRHEYKKKRYEVDILQGLAQSFLRSLGADEPFLLYFAPKAPHVPAIPPKRYRSAFPNAFVARTPDFNEADVSDKPFHIRNLPQLGEKQLDDLHRKRMRTLLAVDDAIAAIWSTLEQTGRLDNTYVFVLSDNGYTIGHHRRIGKTAPYDESVRIPMYVAGPGFAAGAVDNRLVANIDIGPTIADAAGVPLPEADGFSLLQPTTRDALLLEWNFVPTFESDDLTVEAKKGKKKDKQKHKKKKRKKKRRGRGGIATGEVPDYLGLRTLDRLYVVYESGERELYLYDTDPYELDNLLATWDGHVPTAEAETIAAGMATRLEELHDCAGASCR